MYTIQSSNKRIAAVFFLLIVQSGVFASKSRTNCMYGIKTGEKEGWGEPLVEPSTMNCIGDTRSCLRIEVDEIGDPNGERIKNFVAMSCVEECTSKYENVPQEQLNQEVINVVNKIERGFKTDMIGAKARCCTTETCNSEPIPEPSATPEPSAIPEPSAGSNMAASFSFLTVFVAAFYI